MNVKRGQKLCKHCNNVCGARSKVCKHCNKEFEVRTDPMVRMKIKRKKAARKNLIEANWRELRLGQNIYFNGRSGNYDLNSDGTRDYHKDKGVYRVVTILEEGFGAQGKNGYTFFYMGPERPSKWLSNMFNAPHKIYIKKDSKIAQDT